MKVNGFIVGVCLIYMSVIWFWCLTSINDLFNCVILVHTFMSISGAIFIITHRRGGMLPVMMIVLDLIFHTGCAMILYHVGSDILCMSCAYTAVLLSVMCLHLVHTNRLQQSKSASGIQQTLVDELIKQWRVGDFLGVYDKINLLNSRSLVQLTLCLNFETEAEKELFKDMVSC